MLILHALYQKIEEEGTSEEEATLANLLRETALYWHQNQKERHEKKTNLKITFHELSKYQ